MPRGRTPTATTEAERTEKARVQAAVMAAADGQGWETPAANDLLAEQAKIAPFLPIATQLARLGETAATRKEGWARRRFASPEEVQVFTRGLRRALKSLGCSLTVAGPVELSKGTRMKDGTVLDRPVWMVDYRARKTQFRG